MSGETKRSESSWTTDTLKEHIERRFIDQDKAVSAALLAAKEAVIKAEVATEKRFESVNEFRKTLSDQTAGFLPRPEYDANHKALEDKIDNKYQAMDDKIHVLTDRMNLISGKSTGLQAGWGYMVAAVSLAATIIAIILAFNN